MKTNIYAILAALALLPLSLNAQLLPDNKRLVSQGTDIPTANDENARVNAPSRAPLKVDLNAGEYLVGPFTTEDFSTSGLGYFSYPSSQWVYVTTVLDRNEWEDHLGDYIVGFRFALAGTSSQTVSVGDFLAWPLTIASGTFDQTNQHTWNIGDWAGPQTITSTRTVADGTTTNGYLPVYGLWYDATSGQKNQMIYNSSLLGLSAGTQITSLTFYPSAGINFSGGKVKLSLGTTTTSVYSSASALTPTDLVQVAEIVPTANSTQTEWTFNFTTPFTYNGGNLLVQIDTETGTYKATTFYGETQESAIGFYSYNSNAYTQTFLPKATFGYTYTGTANYADLTAGQWHDYYLDEPVEFNVAADSVDQMFIGYSYWQYPSTATSYHRYPIAYNPESMTHDHWTYRSAASSASDIEISTTSTYAHIYSIQVVSGTTTILSWDYDTNGTTLPAGFSLTSGTWNINTTSGYLYSYSGSAVITISGNKLLGYDDVQVIINANVASTSYPGNLTVGGTTKTISTTTATDYTWSFSNVTTYSRAWRTANFGSSYGDLAVQLIFKSSMEKTATPVITTSTTADGVTITATGYGEVTLTVNGQTVTGNGSASITLGRGSEDYTVTATATAIEDGKRESDPATQSVVIPATELDPTPTPTIESTQYDLNVLVGGNGNGSVHFYIDGVEVDNPYYLERKEQDYTVTVVVTAQEDGKAMATTTQQIVIPAHGAIDLSGWTLLDEGLTDEDAIDMGDGLDIVDRFSVNVSGNDHPASYTYRLVEDRDSEDARQSNTMTVPVQRTGSVVNGYYTQQQVDNDKDRALVTDLMNADVEMNLANNPAIYYYTLERGMDEMPSVETSKLQRTLNGTYHEMDAWYKDGIDEFDYGIIHRLDTIGELYRQGSYDKNFMTYVPVVWTLGNATGNVRVNWENDHKHNSYGSPIWQTTPGKVEITTAECARQQGVWAAKWTDEDGHDCRQYRAHIAATGYLPSDRLTNVEYEPYMFRIWVVCDSLRDFEIVDRQYVNVIGDRAGVRWLADVPCVEGDCNLNYGSINDTDKNYDLIFGATMGAHPTFIVRFYYRSKLATIVESSTLRATGDEDARYYPAEAAYDPGDPSTGIMELPAAGHGEVVSTTFVNPQGMKSDRPFDGVNIVVTRYSDGTTRTVKVVKR